MCVKTAAATNMMFAASNLTDAVSNEPVIWIPSVSGTDEDKKMLSPQITVHSKQNGFYDRKRNV